MDTSNYIFLHKDKLTTFQDGDIAKVDTNSKTVAFLRNNERMYIKSDDDKLYIDNISMSNASSVIQEITQLTPVLNTNDSIDDILVFKLRGKNNEDEEVSK